MHRAIDAARRSFDETDWSTNHQLRKRCLEQLHEAIDGEQEELREELIREVGAPRAVTHGPQLDAPLEDGLQYPARLIETFPWETDLGDTVVSVTGVNTTRKVWHEPVGVVGAIMPWNFPFEVTINKLGQALATGNTVVLKPAPDTPFNATRLGRLIAEKTDIPAGVVNIVTASDHLVGEELTLSPKVDMISFTGSTAVGKRIMEKGAATMKRLFLELGGKSATIVLEDADFNTACLIGIGPLMHAGQGCAAPTRMLLPRSRYDEGVAILKAHLREHSRRATRRTPAPCAVRSSRPSSSHASSATSRRASTRAPRCWSAAPSRPSSSTRDSGSTRRFSPTSTTR